MNTHEISSLKAIPDNYNAHDSIVYPLTKQCSTIIDIVQGQYKNISLRTKTTTDYNNNKNINMANKTHAIDCGHRHGH